MLSTLSSDYEAAVGHTRAAAARKIAYAAIRGTARSALAVRALIIRIEKHFSLANITLGSQVEFLSLPEVVFNVVVPTISM